MEKLLVAVDFSPASRNAARFAADVALQINAALILFHVVNINLLVAGLPVTAGTFMKIEDDAELELAGWKEELSDRVMGKIPVSFHRVNGFVAAELSNFSKEIHPLAVVMGVQGKSAMDRIMLGSNTSEAIKGLHSPVWVIPSDAVFTGIKKIALASDMDKTSILPLNTIEHLVKLFSAQLEVIHVSKSENRMDGSVLSGSVGIEDALHALSPSFHYVNNRNIEAGINQFAKEHNINLLLLAPKSRNPLSDLFHKSVSAHICWHPTVPVMTLPEEV
jgi:nucleotide-binding universal stress UspA family protein